ncbi:alpha/beta fold hydrolase [Actinacidiphila epipremni]|uniref:Alpha/beta fold hydrolase n=1 Tax=Actinacidiphila epipremni TaxID=2053013 RepID=A0ABX0ZR59_9ACTN|nr:alpha/beta fold hydrolase [Actinacidiphila epipremni]NJP44128.1 alpha/beta fold hydrolase [Actinacidiphila epipremni]
MTTDWTFGGLWPYQPRWFDTPEGRLHYIDEGPRDADAVVLVHGNPTWGFLYRNFVGPLTAAGHRVVVPDFLGFGRSDKPKDRAVYRADAHTRRLVDLLDSLDLRHATVVVQDWGGLALGWAVARPERADRLFLLNTTAHNPERFDVPFALRLFRLPGVGEVMVKGLSLFHRLFLFGAGTMRRDRLTPDVRRAYLAPHPTWSSRTAVLEFPRQIPTGPVSPVAPLLTALESGLAREFKDRPVKIVWAMKDVAFTPDILEGQWLRTFPDADVVRLPDAGHYLQEDAHEEIVAELLGFLRT